MKRGMTAECLGLDMKPHSRGALRPSFAKSLPSKGRGRREDRVRAAPAVSCAMCTKKGAHEHTGSAETSGLPCAMALRLIARSPRRRILVVTVACGLRLVQARLGRRISAGLTSATDARTTRLRRTQQPVFANRLYGLWRRSSARWPIAHGRPALQPPLARRRCRVHRISTRVRDDRDPPLVWVRRAELCP
jgi:hypothetical protein